jgi:hypothetical protein
MHVPVIKRELLSQLRLVHGGYNFSVMLLFLYQGWLGLKIRRARVSGAILSFPTIRRHRRAGPVFAGLALLGFLFGLSLVLVDTGNVFEYTPHFAVGFLIMLLLTATIVVSRKIRGQDSVNRQRHFLISQAILACYVLEVFLGIGVLL